ncbi:MAG: SIMPL domain-containing protein [Bacteroidaceae bacterium]|nr:SIMPL domain-containing protein [Bacteroidaceae bacterium]
MEKKNQIKEACIIATGILLGLVVLGLSLKGGIDNFTNRDRRVTVKGLAEKEVEADKVTWPIQTKELGNDLPSLYSKINATTAAIKQFLLKNGVKQEEISVNAPTVIDLNAERYGENRRDYRYNITSTITVVSSNVKLVRSIIARQGELLQQGIAIVDGGYEAPIHYDFVAFKEMKPQMMREAIENAEKTALQFAENSHSQLNKIVTADQGQFSIDDRDENTPYIKKVRVVTTVTYSLKD